jgi:ribonuclease P protein component
MKNRSNTRLFSQKYWISHETYISTFRGQAQAHPRVSRSYEDSRWPQGTARTPRQRPCSPRSLSNAVPPLGPIASTRRLPKSSRLNDSKVFVRLLSGRRRTGDCLEIALGRNAGEGARLGIIVGKKNLPRAVDRNALKRIVREAFRERRGELPACDIMIRLRQSLKGQERSAWRPRVADAVKMLFAGAKL